MASTANSNNEPKTGFLKKIIGRPVGKLFPLTSGDVIIGRSPDAEIFVQEPNVSRSHCHLKYNENGWFILDLESVNGTYLNGNRLTPRVPHKLKDGLGIYLGPPVEASVAFVFVSAKSYLSLRRI